MEKNPEYQDLLYFGYDWEPESIKFQADFIKEIKERFPDVVLKDVYDSIKGYRQEVYLDKWESDNYNAFLFGKQWFDFSMTMQISMMSGETEQKEKVHKYIALAKKQYPEAFKPEALDNQTE